MNNDMTQTPADVRGRIIRASIPPIEDEETMIAGLRAGAEAVERGELDAGSFVAVWSQYLRELFRRASSVPAPADVREQIKAAIREGVRYVAKADGAYLYEPSVDETADRILSLLRGAAGEDVRERVAREVFAWEHGRRGAAAEWIRAQWQGETPKRRAMYFDLADRILALLRTPRGEQAEHSRGRSL